MRSRPYPYSGSGVRRWYNAVGVSSPPSLARGDCDARPCSRTARRDACFQLSPGHGVCSGGCIGRAGPSAGAGLCLVGWVGVRG